MNSLERKLIAAIGTVVLLLIAAGVIAFRALNDSMETSQQVANTRETLTDVESTLLSLKDAESDLRGYIVAGRDQFEHFNSVSEEAQRKLTHLKALTANNKGHQDRLARAEPVILKRLAGIHQTLRLRKDQGLTTEKVSAISDEESEQMENIGQLLGEMKAEENDALARRVALSEAGIRNVTISFTCLFILIVALLLLVFFLVKKDLVTQKQLQERLSELASVDELTTLYNRRELNRCLSDEHERFRRYGQAFSLLMLDIDHFKSVNDKYGHPVGDKVLQHIARKIRDGIRAIDIAGRFGGEEFAIILPNTKTADAYMIAERLRLAIAAEPFRFEHANGDLLEVPITTSIGLSTIGDKDETAAHVITAADSALYEAKNNGRDRTVIFHQVMAVQAFTLT